MGGYIIEELRKLKYWEFFFTSGLSTHTNIANIISKVNYRMCTMREAFGFSNRNSKIIFLKSMEISVIRYCSPILIDSEVKILDKLQTQLMKCTRPILGISSFKKSTLQIMTELKILTVQQMIMRESIQFIHKVLTNKAPGVIFELFCQSNCKRENIREVRKYMVKTMHKSNKVTNSLFYRAIYLYNCLSSEVRNYNLKKCPNTFKKILSTF